MGRDRSLDEFLSPSQSDTTPDSSSGSATPDQETDESRNNETESDVATLTVHPAHSTMVWTADDAACDACDSVVQRRWRDDEQLVCSACKEW
jgi:hypothetical protein